MEPQVQYVRSADGTTIATHRLGHGGTPLVIVPIPFAIGTFSANWRMPDTRAAYSALAERRLVVAYDTRGQGLSDAAVADYSLDGRVADLAAVVESASTGAVNLLAPGTAATTAIRFAAENPQRVSRMILWHGVARARDVRLSPSQRALTALIDVDWPLYLAAMAISMVGWEYARPFAEGLAEHVHKEPLVGAYAHRDIDVSDLLASVRCPTLVTFLHQVGNLSIEAPRRLAASISGAGFRVVDGQVADMLFGTADEHTSVIEEFLQDEPGAEGVLPSGTAIILFADIVDSTALTERMGDAAFRERARALDALLRSIIAEGGGTTIDAKTLGDGVLATFPAASQAIDAALRCGIAGDEQSLPLHLGLHAGDVIREANNVFGGAVNIASRISALSAPGEVLVSRTVADLARTSAGVTFADRGEHALKGIADAVRVYAVRKAGSA
jgi:class 3 adenylate cyclase